MTPDIVFDITENILFWQGMWQGIWHLTIYVTFQWISFYYKVCDRGYDTWQYMWYFRKYPFPTRYVTGYMTPDNVCDISVNILFLQCIWQGIWNLTMYVTLKQLACSYKVCDRVYDTWQCMWHLCNFPILTMYVTGDMTPDNVCDISVTILFRQGMWRGIWHLTIYVTPL